MPTGSARPGTGFTYIGLLIFVMVMGIALAATGMMWETVQQRERERELLFIGKQFARAFRSYYNATPAGQARFPTRLEDLLQDPRYPGVRRHLRRIYVDPMTGKAEWAIVPAPGSGIMAVHSLSEQSALKTTGFAPMFSSLRGKTKYSEWTFGVGTGTTAAGNTGPGKGAPSK